MSVISDGVISDGVVSDGEVETTTSTILATIVTTVISTLATTQEDHVSTRFPPPRNWTPSNATLKLPSSFFGWTFVSYI